MNRALSCFLSLAFAAASASAALIVNGAQPITERVTVQVITAAASNGTNTAPGFGNATQQNAIFASINGIWAQAGIDVQFKFRLANWNSDFALLGTTGNNNPRPDTDLNTLFDNAAAAGLLDPDPHVLNLVLARIVPGFSQNDANTANGIAFLPGDGIALWVGASLLTFANGRDLVASVLAHEIGHNLGLDHVLMSENLMQAGGAANPGERLTAAQISAARASSYSVPIPEPQIPLLFAITLVVAASRRLRCARFLHGISHRADRGTATA